MFWVMLVFRLVFWGIVLGVAWYTYNVGWEKVWYDAAWALGLLEGFIQQMIANNSSAGGSSGTAGGWRSQDQWRSSQRRPWR